MKAQKRIRISQCMIVKNEEKNIEKALTWGKAVMWEQIVVDTGSTDRTVELARKHGAKVFFFDWINDFAAAKNYAIEQAGGDWIAFFDADEYMALEDAKALKDVLGQILGKSFDAISMGCQNLDDDGRVFSSGTQLRVFRNIPDIRYRRQIHEQLVAVSGRELHVGDISNEISFFHTGYQKQVLEGKAKKGRNRKLIQEEVEKNPDDHEMLGYMGDECFDDGEYSEAEKWYRRSIERMPGRLPDYDQRSAYTFTRLLTILIRKSSSPGNAAGSEGEGKTREDILRELEGVYQQAAEKLPQEGDFDYLMGRFYAEEDLVERAVKCLESALRKLETYGCYNKALLLASSVMEVYGLLVRCCFAIGDREKCVSYGVAYLKQDRYGMAVLSRLLKVLLPFGGLGEDKAGNPEILGFFLKLYDPASLKDKLFLIKTAEKSGCQGFAAFAAEQLFTAEDRQRMGI